MPTNSFSWSALDRMPTSPTLPIEKPAAWVTMGRLRRSWSHRPVRRPYASTRDSSCMTTSWLSEQRRTFLGDDDRHDHPVDAQDTCHDHWDQGLHDDCRLPDSDAADACACLRRSVRSSEVWLAPSRTRQDQSHADSHKPEESRCVVRRWHSDLYSKDYSFVANSIRQGRTVKIISSGTGAPECHRRPSLASGCALYSSMPYFLLMGTCLCRLWRSRRWTPASGSAWTAHRTILLPKVRVVLTLEWAICVILALSICLGLCECM